MYMSTQNRYLLAAFLIETGSRNTWVNWKQSKFETVMTSKAPHPISLPCTLALPSLSHRDIATPSPCWAPHFMTQERLMFLIPTPSEPRLSPAIDERRHAVGSHSTLALHLYLAACNHSSSCRFWVLDHLCSNLSKSFYSCWITKTRSWKLCVCFLPFPLLPLLSDRNEFQHEVPVCNLVVITQRLYYYFGLTVCWQYQTYWTILILVVCLLCVTPLVCSSYSSFAPSLPFFRSWWQRDCDLFALTLVLQCSPSTSSHQPHTTHVFADSKIALLCHARCICVEHAPPESCKMRLE